MSKLCLEVPEVWLCEECVSLRCVVKENFTKSSTSVHSTGPRKLAAESGRKICERQGTKFISMEEIASLTTGDVAKSISQRKSGSNCGPCKKSESNLQSKFGSNFGSSPKTSLCKKTPHVPKTVPYPVKDKENPCFSPSRNMQSPKHQVKDRENPCFSPLTNMATKRATVQIGSLIPKQAPPLSKQLKGTHVSPAKTTVRKKEVKVPREHADLFNSSDTNIADVAAGMPESLPAPYKLSFFEKMPGGNFHVDTQPKNLNVKMKDLATVYSELEKDFVYSPVNDAIWKGSFNIIDIAATGDLYHALQAHTPAKFRRKTYEFSKKMPAILQFEMLPRCNLWPEMFPGYCPRRSDISLYFFPRNDRYKGYYVSLLQRLKEDDLVMRSHMDSVELLLFSSKQLHDDCQRIDAKYYIWGVFRIPENRKPLTSNQIANADCNDNNVVDMEIDMVGGENVGVLDVTVPRKPWKEISGGTSGGRPSRLDILPSPGFRVQRKSHKEVGGGIPSRMEFPPPPALHVPRKSCKELGSGIPSRMDIPPPPPGFEGCSPIYKKRLPSLSIKKEPTPL